MKILHIISNQDNSGGSIAALSLHEALLAKGHESSVLATDQLFGKLQGKGYRRFGGIIGRLQQMFLKIEHIFAQPGWLNPIDKLLLSKALRNYRGIIHIHVTHVAQLSFSLLDQLCEGNKVVWTFHDLWPLTAKCIHPTYCDKWQTSCSACPKLAEYPVLRWDNTPALHQAKHAFITRHKIDFVSPSRWITNLAAKKIEELGATIKTIPNSINPKLFFPTTMVHVRESFGIPQTAIMVLFPQGRWQDPKKGRQWYEQIVAHMGAASHSGQVFYLVRLIGETTTRIDRNANLVEISLPVAHNATQMNAYYNMADVTISISEIETFGLCVAESLFCQTPVLARAANGVTELLKDKNEIIAHTPTALAELIINETWKKVDYTGLFNAVCEEYSREVTMNQHLKLYGR